MTVGEALRGSEARLAEAGVETPRVDAELLLAHVLGLTRTRVYADRERALEPGQAARLQALVDRRATREPLAYVLGEWGFRRLTLKADFRALVPRPETEIVVERCLELLRGVEAPLVLDVGVGSGAIALAIADEHPGAQVTGFDTSPGAVALARENAELTGLGNRVRLVEHDLRSGFGEGRFDLVVSNPPYVEEDELPGLEPELGWEPRVALVGDGHTEAVAAAAKRALRPGGRLVLEVAGGAAGEVAAQLKALGYGEIRISRDLTGTERVVEGRRAPKESFATADGRTLAYVRSGSGPVLVCHPGGPGCSSLELGSLGGLDERLTLVVLDPRGAGDSDPADSFGLDGYVADLDELRRHLELERIHLLGFSHGGMVAMAYAARFPAHVEGLVLGATLARFPDGVDEAVLERHAGEAWYAEARAGLEQEDEGAYASDEETSAMAYRMFPLYFATFGDAEARWLESIHETMNAEALREFNDSAPDLRPELGRIEARTLVLAGRHDFLCGPAVAEEIADGIRDVRLVLFEHSGHFIYFEEADRFRDEVWRFLDV